MAELTPFRVLFQGDSITDAGRRRDAAPSTIEGLGHGYAYLAGAALLSAHARDGWVVENRGISGDKVTDLENRWEADALAREPDLLSILIGVNDTWHGMPGGRGGVGLEAYEAAYRRILDRTREALPRTRLVLGEPFALRCGAVTADWFPELDHRRAVVRRLAGDYDATLVPFQSVFDEAVDEAEPSYWAADGVHPTAAGHARMARAWGHAVGETQLL